LAITPSLPRGDAVALTRALVAVDSRNPSLVPGAPGEQEAAELLANVLESWGFAVRMDEVAPRRLNVIARIGEGPGRLVFAGHLDTVGVDGMTHDPFDARIAAGKLFGRGAADMKGGIAAMCAAAARSAAAAHCEVIVAAVCDEEYESAGMRFFLSSGLSADAAIVTEPTRLAICPAHRGFAWFIVRFRGRAAHGSRYDIGVDAIRHAGIFLTELDHLDRALLPHKTHPLLGRASVHASTIAGGAGFSTYPEDCVLRIERRTLPGERMDDVIAELESALALARARTMNLDASIELVIAQPPSSVATDTPVVTALATALHEEGAKHRIEGMSAWTDAALLNAEGITAVCFGPGDIALAHSGTEYVDVAEIEVATRVLERVVRNWRD
jgi:acetylornithine deacetylase